jgi:hypothetical protein
MYSKIFEEKEERNVGVRGHVGWRERFFFFDSHLISHQANGPPFVQDHILQGHHMRMGQLPQDLDLAQGGDGDALGGRKKRESE